MHALRPTSPAGLTIHATIVGLTLATSWIHATLGGPLFTLNAIGYLVAAAAIVARVALLVAGSGGTALGDAHPPASLDPGSPTVSAQAIAFDTAVLTVPADRPFTLVFENQENVPHNVSIYAKSAHQERRFE